MTISITPPRALSIAGFDGSGGAGILADVKTFSALGCYGMAVLTALTAQNTQGVTDVVSLEPAFIVEQLRLILDDVGVDVIKLGMLHRYEVMEALVSVLKTIKDVPIVLDPVMISKGGHPLIAKEAVDFLREAVLPLATVITPNRHEAEALTGMQIFSKKDQMEAAELMASRGPKVVIVKGGHVEEGNEDASDYVFMQGTEGFWLQGKRILTKNTHGTGCTFSAAVAALLAKKLPLREALEQAKAYIQKAIEQGASQVIGKGHGPVAHFAGIFR